MRLTSILDAYKMLRAQIKKIPDPDASKWAVAGPEPEISRFRLSVFVSDHVGESRKLA